MTKISALERILFINPELGGISGDMFVSSFVDMGFPKNELIRLLDVLLEKDDRLKINVSFDDVRRRGLKSKLLKIEYPEVNLSVKELKRVLEESLASLNIKGKYRNYAIGVLNTLIEAESNVHNMPLDKIHFHELSSPDTLFDILAVTSALKYYSLLESNVVIYSKPLPVGLGSIEISHGNVDVPAPAVMEILKKYKIPFYYGPVECELATPTGVALLANLQPIFEVVPYRIIIDVQGCGAGSNVCNNFPNILRLSIYNIFSKEERNKKTIKESIVTLETNLDDISGERLGFLVNELLSLGAYDVSIIPTVTKKNRPGYIVKVLSSIKLEKMLLEKLFELTDTLGIRRFVTERYILMRGIKKLEIKVKGDTFVVSLKFFYDINGRVKYKPEFDDLVRISKETNLSIEEIETIIREKIKSSELL